MVETVNAGPVRDFLLIVLPKTTNRSSFTPLRSSPRSTPPSAGKRAAHALSLTFDRSRANARQAKERPLPPRGCER